MQYHQIQEKEELCELKGKSIDCHGITFCFSEHYIVSLQQLLERSHPYQLFAKDDEGSFAGYIASAEMEPLRLDFLWIVELFVDPAYHRRGIASELIRRVIAQAKAYRLKGVIAQTEFDNKPAQALYKKMGFVEIENPFWEDGVTYELTC